MGGAGVFDVGTDDTAKAKVIYHEENELAMACRLDAELLRKSDHVCVAWQMS